MKVKVEHDTEYRRGYIEALLDAYDRLEAIHSCAGMVAIDEMLKELKGE